MHYRFDFQKKYLQRKILEVILWLLETSDTDTLRHGW